MRFDKQWAARLITVILSLIPILQSSNSQVLVYKKKYVMGTVFEVAAYSDSLEHTSAAIDDALQEIVRVDDLMSNYKPDSALSNLNRSAHFHTQKVPIDLYRAIERAVRFSKLSGGKFDITVAPLVNLWKAALAGDSMPTPAQRRKAQECVGYEKIELTSPDEVTFHSSCMQLDLGAIGKGYAVDRAGEILQSSGIHNAFINSGGSTILAMGSPPGQHGWLVHLCDPSHKIDPYVLLQDQSVSTSEQTTRSLLAPDSAGHIIDPSNGAPIDTRFAVSVITPLGIPSDGLSTTLLLLGPKAGKLLVDGMTNISAIWVSPKAEIETATGGTQILFGKKL
jgi:thiamine biosynthesis lipoprotein ApbE